MKLDNRARLSLAVSLAILSKDISFARYTIKQAYNKSVYTIKTKDGNLDYTFDMTGKNIPEDMLECVLQKVLEEKFPTRRVPRMDELDDNMIIKKFTDVINYLVQEPKDKSSTEYVRYHEDLINLQNNLMALCDMAEECNILNDELNILTIPLFILDTMILKNTKDPQLSNRADTEKLLKGCLDNGEIALEQTVYKDYPWAKSTGLKDSDRELEKEIARIITYCMISKDIAPSIDINERMDNVMQFSAMFSNGQTLTFALSNRECEEKDLKEFKDKIYDEILSRNGFSDTSVYSPEDKEAFVMTILKQNVDVSSTILYGCKKCIEDHVINFGRDQNIFNSVILNVLDLMGGNDDEYPNGLELENKGCAEINNLFDRNYDKVSEDPTLAYKMISKYLKQFSSSGIRDYLQSKYPDAEIKEITIDNLDNLPPELADIIAGTLQQLMGQSEEKEFDPTVNYPYPDEDELNDDGQDYT